MATAPDEPPKSPPILGVDIGPDLPTRTMSALVLAPIVLGLGWIGGWTFAVFCAGLALLVMWEWRKVTGWQSHVVVRGDFVAGVALAVLASAFFGVAIGGGLGLLVLGVALATARSPKCTDMGERPGPWAAFGVLYAVLPAIALQSLRGDSQLGLWAIVFVFAVVWSTDIGAYFAGRILRGPKLFPSISPKKTWAGALGGFAGALGAAVAVGYAANLPHLTPVVLLAGAASITSQAGDLFESWIKRRFSVKDSSHLIPGHGGVMDRVDGLLAAVLFLAVVGWLRSGFQSAAGGILDW